MAVTSKESIRESIRFDVEYIERRKSVGIAYLLFFTLGVLGMHRLYIGDDKSLAIALFEMGFLAASIFGPFVGMGFVILGSIPALMIVLIFDLFAIPGAIARENTKVRLELAKEFFDE